MTVKFLCKICCNAVAKNHHAIQYDKCHIWVHIKCNRINLQTYKYLEKKCISTFQNLQTKNFFKQIRAKQINVKAIISHATPKRHDLIDALNNVVDDPESDINSK